MRLFFLLASVLLPGAGHIAVGRQFKGFLIALIYTLTLMAALIRVLLLWPEASLIRDPYFLCAAVLAICIWLWAIADLYQIIGGLGRAAPHSQVDKYLRQGTIYYLRGELLEAARQLEKASRLAPCDVDVRIYLARVYHAIGLRSKYRKLLRKCRVLDTEEKWAAEINELLSET